MEVSTGVSGLQEEREEKERAEIERADPGVDVGISYHQ